MQILAHTCVSRSVFAWVLLEFYTLNSIFIAKSLIYGADLEHSPCFFFFFHCSVGKMGRTITTLTSDTIFPVYIYFFVTLTPDRVHTQLSLAAFRSLFPFCSASVLPLPPTLQTSPPTRSISHTYCLPARSLLLSDRR